MISRGRLFFVILLALVNSIGRSQATDPQAFLIEPNRPIVYLAVDHVGLDATRGQRIWLKFHNNCKLPIDLHVNGAPVEAPDDRVTVMYQLVRPAEGILVFEDGRRPVRKDLKVPPDTMSEVGSVATVLPGEGILFSVPRSHFSPDWEMHIPFWFRLPPGKGPRDDAAWGGDPQMFLSYAFWDLPTSIQSLLKSKVGK